MEKVETIQDIRAFLDSNRNKLLERAVLIEELPTDDEWVQDDVWDDIYRKEAIANGKV